jgi:dsRNA-specific ribonuclease
MLIAIRLQRLAQTVVRGTALSRIALSIGLAQHIRCHPDKLSQHVLEDVMESLLAVMTEELGDQEAYIWLESVMGDLLEENKRRIHGPQPVFVNVDETVNILHPAPLWTWINRRYKKMTREWAELFIIVRGRMTGWRKRLDHRIRKRRQLWHRLGIVPRIRRVRNYVKGRWGSYRHQLKFQIRPRVLGTARGVANRMKITPGLARARAYVRGRWKTYRHHLNVRVRPGMVRTGRRIKQRYRIIQAYLRSHRGALQRTIRAPGEEKAAQEAAPTSNLTLRRMRKRATQTKKAKPGKNARLVKIKKILSNQVEELKLSDEHAPKSSEVHKPTESATGKDSTQLQPTTLQNVVDPKSMLLQHTQKRRVRYKTVKVPSSRSAEWHESVEVAGLGQFVGVGIRKREAQKNAARMMLQSLSENKATS